jgi:CTP synthase
MEQNLENNSMNEMFSKMNLLLSGSVNNIQKSRKNMKYLFTCGTTISGIGKGSTMSGIGLLLKACGLRVNCVKVDPYLNIDAGTMSPYEHGEVFVLEDGGEVDLDLGNYERTLRITLNKDHNITSGKVFAEVINNERKGIYLGKTVQMIPHVTDKIKEMIEKAAHNIVEKDMNKEPEICLVEIGGTVGDLESGIFFEAIRQFTNEIGNENYAILMLSFVPEIGSDPPEPKTKPTQFGIKELKSLGISPNFLVCRSKEELNEQYIKKIAFCSNLPEGNVITMYNIDTIWDVPLVLASQNLHFKIMSHLNLPLREYKIHKWIRLSEHIRQLKTNSTEVKIAVCGKYIHSTDTYYSIMKSLQDGAFSANRNLTIEWLDCTIFDGENNIEENERKKLKVDFWRKLEGCGGILVPGGKNIKYYIFRIWKKRSRGYDRGMPLCKRKFNPLPRNLSWYASCCNRILQKCFRNRKCKQ